MATPSAVQSDPVGSGQASDDQAWLWQPSLPGIELFEAQLRHHRFGKHFHEAYTIGLNEAGLGCCDHGSEHHIMVPGQFNVLNPGELHTGQVMSATAGWSFRNLYIDPSVMRQTLVHLDWSGTALPCFRSPILREPTLRPQFYRLFHALANSTSPLQQQSLLLDLLASLWRCQVSPQFPVRYPQSESRAVGLVREYLETHYQDKVAIADLAQLTNLSPYYLIRCFRQQVGCAPHQYQRHWQLIQVKRALGQPHSLARIATDHGFYDQSHLNRAFKQVFGVTPGQYRRAILSNPDHQPAP